MFPPSFCNSTPANLQHKQIDKPLPKHSERKSYLNSTGGKRKSYPKIQCFLLGQQTSRWSRFFFFLLPFLHRFFNSPSHNCQGAAQSSPLKLFKLYAFALSIPLSQQCQWLLLTGGKSNKIFVLTVLEKILRMNWS